MQDSRAPSRRTVLKATGLLAVAGLGSGTSIAQTEDESESGGDSDTDVTIEIEQFPEEEYIVLRNVGDSDVDLEGYSLNFDAEGGNDQVEQIAGSPDVPAGQEASVATGDQTMVETDYELVEPYNGSVLANDESDVVALLDPDGNEVARTGDGGDGDDEETNTLTVNLPNDVDGVAVTVSEQLSPDDEGEDPYEETKASAGGQVQFRLESGYYYVDAEGYNETLVAIDVTEDREITLQSTDVDPVEITVVDSVTGEPIEGAVLEGVCDLYYSSGDSYITGETNENGVAMAQAGVTPTACDTRVSAEGYEDAHVRVHVPDDDGLTVELVPEDAAGGDGGDETDDGDGDTDNTSDDQDGDDETDDGDQEPSDDQSGQTDDDATEGNSDTEDKETEKDPNCP